MHELGVTFHIMDHLEKVAAENKVTHWSNEEYYSIRM